MATPSRAPIGYPVTSETISLVVSARARRARRFYAPTRAPRQLNTCARIQQRACAQRLAPRYLPPSLPPNELSIARGKFDREQEREKNARGKTIALNGRTWLIEPHKTYCAYLGYSPGRRGVVECVDTSHADMSRLGCESRRNACTYIRPACAWVDLSYTAEGTCVRHACCTRCLFVRRVQVRGSRPNAEGAAPEPPPPTPSVGRLSPVTLSAEDKVIYERAKFSASSAPSSGLYRYPIVL